MINSISNHQTTTPIYSGPGIPFQSSSSEIGKIAALLFSQVSPTSSRELLTAYNIKNIFYDASPEYLSSFREVLKTVILQAAFDPKRTLPDDLLTLFINQTLSYLPYTYPQDDFEIDIPIKGDQGWELKHYTLDRKFRLGEQFLLSPMPAYGLKSPDGGPPLLIFMGTTYPSGRGFLGTLLSDFTPGASVGQLPMLAGQKEIGEWLQKNPGAHAMGMSLGGALSLHAAKRFKSIAKVFAFVPPGLYRRELKDFEDSSTEISLLFQGKDFVSTLGFFPEGNNVTLYHAYGVENGIPSHAKVELGSETVNVFKVSPKVENEKTSRKILTALHRIFSPLIFILLLPFYFVASFFKLLNLALSKISLRVSISRYRLSLLCQRVSSTTLQTQSVQEV